MAKFGILNWYYCESGSWLTISSTDFDALQSLAPAICQHFSDQAKTKYTQFSAGGGSITIQNAVFTPINGESIEDIMGYMLTQNDWEQGNTL
jgi:hypothetical protein